MIAEQWLWKKKIWLCNCAGNIIRQENSCLEWRGKAWRTQNQNRTCMFLQRRQTRVSSLLICTKRTHERLSTLRHREKTPQNWAETSQKHFLPLCLIMCLIRERNWTLQLCLGSYTWRKKRLQVVQRQTRKQHQFWDFQRDRGDKWPVQATGNVLRGLCIVLWGGWRGHQQKSIRRAIYWFIWKVFSLVKSMNIVGEKHKSPVLWGITLRQFHYWLRKPGWSLFYSH